jgi:hypothetical protein
VLHADVSAKGVPENWTVLHRGEAGDPRASTQNNLQAEFLGDYVYASATPDYAVAVWNDGSARSRRTRTRCVRSDVYRPRASRAARGHEQRRRHVCGRAVGRPHLVDLAPGAHLDIRAAGQLRPQIDVDGQVTLVLVAQTAAVDLNGSASGSPGCRWAPSTRP